MISRPDPPGGTVGGGKIKRRDLEARGNNRRVLTAVAILIVVIGGITAAALLTLNITPDQPASEDVTYPYTTNFLASLPDGESVRVGSLDILALQTVDRMALRIGDHREEMQLGETRQIGGRVFSIRVLGITVFETGYQLRATWTGVEGNRAIFRIVLRTSRQVPDWLMGRVLPAAIEATPN